MPGWHKELRDLVQSKQLVLLGVVQEQHAERCQLYANWQQLDWPILHDPINLLECTAVPITIAIDERGVVQSTRPSLDWVKNEFLQASSSDSNTSKTAAAEPEKPSTETLLARAKVQHTATAWSAYGDAVMLWEPESSSKAVNAYQQAIRLSDSPMLHFRLGVALRHRSESSDRKRQDFASAVQQWTMALHADPNQYIWRRRIQQYGPRLDKPYPFYDWIDTAISDVTQRDGKPPASLRIPLSGAELAQPARSSSKPTTATIDVSPDPTNRIRRDTGLVQLESTIVASSQAKRPGYRLHFEFSVSDQADWNNEAEPIQVWFEESPGVTLARRRLQHQPQISSAESDENRVLDVEFTTESVALPTIRGFALYYICEKSTQQCILRRQDFAIPIRIE